MYLVFIFSWVVLAGLAGAYGRWQMFLIFLAGIVALASIPVFTYLLNPLPAGVPDDGRGIGTGFFMAFALIGVGAGAAAFAICFLVRVLAQRLKDK